MQTLIIILTVIIIILAITFHITIDVEYDALNNIGKVKLILFKFIVLFVANITIAGEYLTFKRSNKKAIKIKIDIKDEKLQFFKDFDTYLQKKIYVTKMGIYSLISFLNPMASTITSGIFNILISLLLAKETAKRPEMEVEKKILTGFRHTELKFKIIFTFAISLYDILWSFLKAYKAYRRRMYERTYKTKQQAR